MGRTESERLRTPKVTEKVMHHRWIASGIAALALAATTVRAPSPALRIAQAGIGQSGDFYNVEAGDDGVSLIELITTAGHLTGEQFLYDPRELKDVRVNFTGKMSFPREKFWSFLDWCLHDVGFVEGERMVAGVRIHSITKLPGGGGGGNRSNMALKMSAPILERAELDAIADRFILVTTTYVCRNLPPREAVTTLQLYFADSVTEAIRNIEGTNAILMTGFAPNVAAICAMLERLDAQVGKSESFLKSKELAERVEALESKVAALIEQSQPKEKREDSGRK